MINLIRNELCKIFHKKAIYVYTTIILVLLIGISVLGKMYRNTEDDNLGYDSSYVESLEEGLDNYDLSDKNELDMFIGDKVLIDVYDIASKYKFDDPERYYVDTVIEPLIYNKYHLEYENKDIEAAKEVQKEIDSEISKLDNFDWKESIEVEKREIEEQIKLLKDTKDNQELERLKIELWCLNFRLENNIPYSYKSDSILVDEYKSASAEYISLVKDESLIKNADELRNKRSVEEKYHVTKYKLEHKLYGDSQELKDIVISGISYVDGLVIIAIIIIAGSIISEEFSRGTIKQLLVKPHSRVKILSSKIIASLIAITIFVILYNGVFILANCYEFSDFKSLLGNNVIYDFNLGKVREISFLGHCLYGFITVLPAYLIIFFLTIFVGVLTTSTIATISSALGIYFFYDVFSLALKPKILSFLPFYCWDLSPYMFGGLSPNKYCTFGKSLVIDILTIIVLLILSYVLFKKKEIKNQ